MKIFVGLLLFAEVFWEYCVAEYEVTVTHNGPVVLGATISFKAELYNDGDRPTEKFKYTWRDNAIPSHSNESESSNGVSYWNASYPASEGYVQGQYDAEVKVSKWVLFYWPVISRRVQFDITAKLNGRMDIIQSGVVRTTAYISNAEEVKHQVVLHGPDAEYLSRATQVYSFWYVDCVYYGMAEGYEFSFNYTEEEKSHTVEVLVMASFDPIPTPEPSTTIIPSTTTSAAPNENKTTTTVKTTTSSTTPPSVVKDKNGLLEKQMLATNVIGDVPYICMNSSIIPPDPHKIYGYFSRQLKAKAPVTNVSINGNKWMKHGDILNLQITCQGSSPYTHCTQIVYGPYNITGNETCRPDETSTSSDCEFKVKHYFSIAKLYTVLVIISNDVNVNVTQVAINIYEDTKKAQLSVIVVPVVCTILAVILIIFGVAYYVQNQRRFVVEVADFHFGHVDVDMECKTFRERLREAIMNAFNRSVTEDDNSDSDSECDKRTGRGIWPTRGVGNAAGPSSSIGSGGPSVIGGRGEARGQKYGSME